MILNNVASIVMSSPSVRYRNDNWWLGCHPEERSFDEGSQKPYLLGKILHLDFNGAHNDRCEDSPSEDIGQNNLNENSYEERQLYPA